MLVWTHKYALGIRRLDADHVTLVALLNQLHINLAEDRSDHALEPILAALINYADYHFRFEERIMVESHYPGAAAHKAIHDSFRARIQDLLGEPVRSRDGARKLRALLGSWLFDHIVKADGDLGGWLRANAFAVSEVPHPILDGTREAEEVSAS